MDLGLCFTYWSSLSICFMTHNLTRLLLLLFFPFIFSLIKSSDLVPCKKDHKKYNDMCVIQLCKNENVYMQFFSSPPNVYVIYESIPSLINVFVVQKNKSKNNSMQTVERFSVKTFCVCLSLKPMVVIIAKSFR